MAYAMTKQGSLDNCITYEFMCDTVEDMNAIENRYRTLGSVAIVLGDGAVEVYIANSQKQWNSLSTISTGEDPVGGLTIYICTQEEVTNGVPNIEYPDETTVYLVASGNTSGNLYEEYIYTNNAWERFGAANIDLSGYAPIANPAFTGSISLGRQANSTIGSNSIAIGDGATASGNNSQSFGNGTVASGANSHAEGYKETSSNYRTFNGSSYYYGATNTAAHSEGHDTIAAGIYSHAEGTDTLAGNLCTHSEGYQTIAVGTAAHSEGYGGTITNFSTTYTSQAGGTADHVEGMMCYANSGASSPGAHAEGNGTASTGGSAHAEGYGTWAGGMGAHAEGHTTRADAQGSHSEGQTTQASGKYAHAEGLETIAAGQGSHAEGDGGTFTINNVTYTAGAYGQYDHAEGYRCMTADSMPGNHAEGYYTRATGGGAHSEGNCTWASNNTTHAEGNYSTASGYCSHAEGNYSTASGAISHAEGNNATSSGESSHAEGSGTTSSGSASHAEGAGSEASGDSSHAEGSGTIAAGSYSHVSGMNNVADYYNTTEWPVWTARTSYSVGDKVSRSLTDGVEGYICKTANSDSTFNINRWTRQYHKMKYAEIVGNGSSSLSKSNARALDWDGNEYLKGDLYVGCDANSSGGTKLARIPDPPSTNGIYTLQATVSDGTITYTWVAGE